MADGTKKTLGDQVIDTIVTALGRGLEGFTTKQKDRIGQLVKPMVTDYLATLPDGHPTRVLMASYESNTSVTDIIAWIIGFIPGLVMMILALADPMAEEGRQWAAEANPNKLAPGQAQVLAALHAWPQDIGTKGYLKKQGLSATQQDIMFQAAERPLDENSILQALGRGWLSPKMATTLLNRIGYSDGSANTLQRLFWRLPAVQDLIRMAVREVFSPEIAQRFGQFQDLPPDFVAEAAKQGLDATTAGWYWAAHWDLPSPSQGFEMLHRGVISEADLDTLLRALDVMPFWRAPLKAIAFNPLTRVDVRRMYHLGVLTDAEVIKSYKDLGYNEENAQRMLEFTRQYYGPEDEDPEDTDREWTKAEVLDGYRKGILTTDQAREALQTMAYPDAKIDFYLSREDYKASNSRRQAYIDTYHSLFINGIVSAAEVSNALQTLGVSGTEIDDNLALWYLQQVQAVQRPTKAELIRWLKAGIISESEWTVEMRQYGYSDKYLEWYKADIAEAT